jgi:hypothetical protein
MHACGLVHRAEEKQTTDALQLHEHRVRAIASG